MYCKQNVEGGNWENKWLLDNIDFNLQICGKIIIQYIVEVKQMIFVVPVEEKRESIIILHVNEALVNNLNLVPYFL